MKRAGKKGFLVLLMFLIIFAMAAPASAASKPKLSKKTATVYVGKSVKLKVTGTKSKVTWSSTKKKVAKVNSSGKVTAVKAGKATIKAKVGKTTLSCKVTVKAVTLSQKKVRLEVGASKKIKLNGSKIKSVSSSNKKVATIAKSGKITAKKAGTCTMTIKGQNNKKYTCKVTVVNKKVPVTEKIPVTGVTLDKTSATLQAGESVALTVTVTPANADNAAITWSSSNTGVATVDGNGVVTAVAAGSATITATAADGSGKSASCEITVTKPAVLVTEITLDKTSVELVAGSKETLTATVAPADADNQTVTWSSSNADVATVDDNGVVTAVAAGSATITATAADGSGKSASCEITVTKPAVLVTEITLDKTSMELVAGAKGTLTATVAPADADNQTVIWSSSDVDVATVDDNGVVTAVAAGRATITVMATDGSGKSASCEITVTSPTPDPSPTPEPGPTPEPSPTPDPKPVVLVTGITLDKTSMELVAGAKETLTATVAPADADNQTLTWSSSSAGVATVDGNGVVTAVAAGSADITATATDGSGKSAVCKVTVKDAEINTPEQVGEDLASFKAMGARSVTIASEAKTPFIIPAGDYSGMDLVVDVPNGEVENSANFAKIQVKAISSNTFIEKAVGNTIIFEASSGTIHVEENASASVSVNSADSALALVNDGSVDVTLNAVTKLTVTGERNATIPVTATAAAGGSTIDTNQNLSITAQAKLSLLLREGAERTTAEITDNANVPEVEGLGSVTVTNTADGSVETVVADNSDENATKVTVTGTVRTQGGNALPEGATAYLVKYSREINTESIDSYLADAKTVKLTAEGVYSFADVSIGNYYLVVKAEGYETSVEIVNVSSGASGVYSNGETTILPEGMEGTGSLSGTVIDAHTGSAVTYPVVIKLRKGGNNLSGPALKTVETEDGKYHFDDLEAGTYTVQALSSSDTDVSIVYTSVTVTVAAGIESVCDITVSTSIENDGMRFVLGWGGAESGAPADLDSHLVGPTGYGDRFHTWFSDKRFYDDDGTLVADLDVDDTTWEGPETTTIRQMKQGVYSFYVYDFSNQSNVDSTEMSAKSNAYVRVIDAGGKTDREIIYIPKNGSGNLWHVCDYDSTTNKLTVVNTVGYWPDDDGSNVGSMSELDATKSRLRREIDNLRALCDELLADDDSMKAEIESALSAAETLYSGSQDASALNEMASKLAGYADTLEDLKKKNDLDDALPLTLGTTVDVSITPENSNRYYSFTPAEDGDYTFIIRAVTEGAYPYVAFYEGYEDFYGYNSNSIGNTFVQGAALTGGTKYVVRLREDELEEAEYTISVVKGAQIKDLVYAINSVRSLSNDCLEDTDPKKAEIESTLAEAENLLLNVNGNDTAIGEMVTKLYAYEEELENLPALSLKQAIDEAAALTLGTSSDVNLEEYTHYYSFTPDSDGEYTFILRYTAEDADVSTSVYKGYMPASDMANSYIKGAVAMSGSLTTGEKCTARISLDVYDDEKTSATITVVKGRTIFEMIGAIYSLEDYLDYYEMDDSLRTEAQALLAEAKALLDNWNEAEGAAMIGKLEDCYERIQNAELTEDISMDLLEPVAEDELGSDVVMETDPEEILIEEASTEAVMETEPEGLLLEEASTEAQTEVLTETDTASETLTATETEAAAETPVATETEAAAQTEAVVAEEITEMTQPVTVEEPVAEIAP